MALNKILHKGKTIYFNDWTNLKNPKDFAPKIEEGNSNTKFLIDLDKKDVLTLTDVTGSFTFGETIQWIKDAAKLAKPITKKSATVGLSTSKKILLNSLNSFSKSEVKAFDTIEEAKDWLVL